MVASEVSGAKLNVTPLPDGAVPEFRRTVTWFCMLGTTTTSMVSLAEASFVAAYPCEAPRITNNEQATSETRENLCRKLLWNLVRGTINSPQPADPREEEKRSASWLSYFGNQST